MKQLFRELCASVVSFAASTSSTRRRFAQVSLFLLSAVTALASAQSATPVAASAPGTSGASSTAAYEPGRSPFRFETTPGALSKSVIPERSRLSLELDPYGERFSGSITHVVRLTAPTQRIVLHADDLTIGKVVVSGLEGEATVTADKRSQTIALALPAPLPVGTHEITLPFSGKLTANGYGLYFARYKGADGSDKRMLATQLESIGAREMMPCFDEPAFRTVWEVSITTDEKYTALSNMPVVRQTQAGGKRRTDFAPSPAMSSYLLAIAVGEFEKSSDRFEDIELNIYTVAGNHRNTAYAMEASKRLLAYFKDYFGSSYPLPKLDQIAVPGKRGAMENWGLITYSESLLMVDAERASFGQRFWSFNVIAHEISHQWFGNLVTMAWWDGLWLNESFAEWMAYKATAALNPQWDLTGMRADSRGKAMAVDVLANTQPIERAVLRDQTSGDLFDPISYEKGHSVLNMIERYAGETAWRDGLREYMRRHAYSNASSADLWAAINRQSAKDVQAFASSWTRQAGFPLLNVTAHCQGGRQTVRIAQSRFALKPGYVPQQVWNVALLVSQPGAANAGTTPQTVFVAALTPKDVPAGRCGDAVLVDVGATGYYRVRYDATLQRALDARRDHLGVADRRRLLTDAWELGEAGLESPKRALDMIAALRGDDAPELWSEAIGIYARLQQLLRDGPTLTAVHAHARTTLGRGFAHLGWKPGAGERDVTRSLRAELIGALAGYDEAAVLAKSRELFAAFIGGDATIDNDVLTGVLRAIGTAATASDVKQLSALAADSRHVELEWPVLSALSSVRDPAVALQALALTLTDALPRSTANRLAGRLARNGQHDALVWRFTDEHWPALSKRNSAYSQRYMLAAPLSGSRDLKLAATIKAAAEAKLEPDARTEVLRELASVERNAWAYEAIRGRLAFLSATSARPANPAPRGRAGQPAPAKAAS